ncbi:MAG: UvrD-helicase domain-containing protein [Dysgonamonadaceae bacterium]|jgi:ATP-dependent exoDNAse (exonuclease V) beta subunit|nr:UvrD-helicase domain-containing protein [Dysgonamonadaceae bacterium]
MTGMLKIYKASAGSGKTYTLALEYIKELLASPVTDNYKHILAVTFTKDATGEMKSRILAELYGLAFNTIDSQGFMSDVQKQISEKGAEISEKTIRNKSKQMLNSILHNYSYLNITTIDSFFQKALRNLARELGKGSRFNLEMNTGKVLSEAVKATIEKASENRQILDWLTAYIENKLDESKNWRIEEEIFDFSHCIYNEFFQEHEWLLRKQLENNPKLFADLKKQQHASQNECKDFFRKTSGRINQILNERHLETSDFGNSKYAIALFNKLAQGDYKASIGATIEKCRTDSSAWGGAKSKRKNEIIALAESDFIPLLNQTIKTLSLFNTSQMITRNLHQLGLIWDITKEISLQNAENNRFMLSDTALFLNRMIDNSDAPFIYEKLGAKIHHIMIDEFQDTSRLQWNNFRVLLSEIIANNNFSLIVGDVKQSIYRWRNGDWRILENIDSELHTPVLNLAHNYRSEKEVVEFNNCLFTCAANSLHELYESQWGAAGSPFPSAYNPDTLVQKSNKTDNNGFISIDFLSDKTDGEETYDSRMKKTILEKLLQLSQAGIPAHKICILTRYNKDIVQLGKYLSSLKNDYPALAGNSYLDLVSNEAFQLNSSLAIRIIISALRCIADPENSVAQAQLEWLLRLIPGADDAKENKTDSYRQLRANAIPLSFGEGFGTRYIYHLFNLERIPGQTAYLFTFYDSISAYLNEKSPDLHQFLDYWDEELYKKTIAHSEGVDGVVAMSIHKSKGLQFHTVIIPYCDWEINPRAGTTVWCGAKPDLYNIEMLPVSYSKGMSETVFAEEYKEETAQSWMDNLNVLYVAFTRAEHNLLILARENEKLDGVSKISSVSDLLQMNRNKLNGELNDENRYFKRGILNAIQEKTDKIQDNLLKQEPVPYPVTFVSQIFKSGESIFKQSIQSRKFTNPDAYPNEKYVAYGNVMHKLFEQIHKISDIDRAIENHISEGLISLCDKQAYENKIRAAIIESQVEDWFSERYKIYSESTILIEEDGELKQKRPDRVLISDNSTIVIDFKFGEMHKSHTEQVLQYMHLLEKMNYPQIEGFLWYVETRQKIPVSLSFPVR